MFGLSFLQPYLAYRLLGHPIQYYVEALTLFVVLSMGFFLIKHITIRYIARIAARTSNEVDDTFVDVIKAIPKRYIYFLALFLSLRLFALPQWFSQALFVILVFWSTYYVMRVVQILVRHLSHTYISKHTNAQGAIAMFTLIIQGTLWILAFVLILSNIGINVTSLITGLGIGGIAIALALQNVLGDLFSYFAIHFDQPFSIGDYVVVGNTTGHITKIGVRTTRIKSLEGEEVVVSNKEITSSQIKNFKRLQRRRIAFTLGLTYSTPLAQLKQIPPLVEHIISKVDDVTFERCHFRAFGASSQDMDVVYHVESNDFRTYVDANEKILLGIKEAFEKEGIEFAFPTQTLHVEKE